MQESQTRQGKKTSGSHHKPASIPSKNLISAIAHASAISAEDIQRNVAINQQLQEKHLRTVNVVGDGNYFSHLCLSTWPPIRLRQTSTISRLPHPQAI